MTPAAIARWRLNNTMTQSELARLLGVDHSTVWRWEHSKTDIPPFLHLALKAISCP